VDRHHGIKQKREINAFGLDSQFEILTITVKCPRALGCSDADARLIGPAE
jgi:hypothetical protein